jgi:T5SS/PEP-CTERM-associated repeat protein
MKTRYISRLATILALSFLHCACAYAATGGSGTSGDPFVVDQADFVMDSGYYEIAQSMTFADGKFVKLGVDNKGNHLAIDEDATVSAYVFVVGENENGVGEISVSKAIFEPSILWVGHKGEGLLTVANGGSVLCLQALFASDAGSEGVVRVTGAGSLMRVRDFINNAQYGEGIVDVEDGALVVVGSAGVNKSYLSGGGGVIRINGGFLAVPGDIRADKPDAELDAIYHFEKRFSALWSPVGIASLKVTYIDGVANTWAGSNLYAAYHDRIDLTGYTVVTSAANDYAWADATSSSKAGWYRSSWFGWFYNDDTMNGWIFSPTHGYIYVCADSTSGEVYFWDSSANKWWFTSKSHYPYLYDYTDETWCFYDKGVYPHRRFYEYSIKENVEESGLRK